MASSEGAKSDDDLVAFSTEAGVADMLVRMKSGRFKVAAACIEWQEEFQGYHRKDGLIVKSNDDLMSATRVGIMQIRSAKDVPLGSRITKSKGGVEICDGVDPHPWGADY